MRFLLRLLINACALWVATQLVSGVTYQGDLLPFLGVALIFGVVNATIRPVAKILKLVPLVKPVFPRYRQMLEDAGRDDLAEAA